MESKEEFDEITVDEFGLIITEDNCDDDYDKELERQWEEEDEVKEKEEIEREFENEENCLNIEEEGSEIYTDEENVIYFD